MSHVSVVDAEPLNMQLDYEHVVSVRHRSGSCKGLMDSAPCRPVHPSEPLHIHLHVWSFYFLSYSSLYDAGCASQSSPAEHRVNMGMDEVGHPPTACLCLYSGYLLLEIFSVSLVFNEIRRKLFVCSVSAYIPCCVSCWRN